MTGGEMTRPVDKGETNDTGNEEHQQQQQMRNIEERMKDDEGWEAAGNPTTKLAGEEEQLKDEGKVAKRRGEGDRQEDDEGKRMQQGGMESSGDWTEKTGEGLEEGHVDVDEVITFEDLLWVVVGKRGRWNYYLYLICCYAGLVSAMQTMSYQFLGSTPGYWCRVDQLHDANWTADQILDFAIPIHNETGEREGCRMYDHDYEAAAAMGYEDAVAALALNPPALIPCPHRDYNLSEYKSTVTTEWDLVCEQRAVYSTTQAAAQMGKLTGYLMFGFLLDTYGRRKIVLASSFLTIFAAFGMCFSLNVWIFIILKVATMTAMSGVYLGCFLTQMEMCNPKDRSMFATMYVMPWAVGYMLLPGIAYWVRTWKWLQAAISVPALVLIAYYWVFPDSPRWLILQGRYDEALAVLKRAGKMNGNVLPLDSQLLAAMHAIHKKEPDTKKHTSMLKVLYDSVAIFRFKALRKRAMKVFWCWFACALVYYGVSLNATNLSTDVYLYIFLGGLLEVPSYFLLWPAIVFFGRVKSLAGLFFMCAVSILIVAAIIFFIPAAPVWITTITSLVGKMAITAAFHLVWLFSTELFPTYYRSIAMGEASVLGRIGSISSPYINDILGELVVWAPSLVFGLVSLLASGISLLLPETLGQNLPEGTDLDGGKKQKEGRENAAYSVECHKERSSGKAAEARGELVKDAVKEGNGIKEENKLQNVSLEKVDTKL